MNRTIVNVAVAAIRLWLLAGNWSWNDGTVIGIIPGLKCWYCVAWQAPYGIIWHILSVPGLIFDKPSPFIGFNFYITIVDLAVMELVKNTRLLWPTYVIFSGWIFLQAPWDLPVLWITVTGMWKWPLAFLGIVAKLPVGSEPWGWATWNYLLHKPYLATDWQYFSFMGLIFLATILEYKIRLNHRLALERANV